MSANDLKTRLSEIQDRLTSLEQTGDRRFMLTCDSEDSATVNRFLFETLGLRFVIATGIDSDHCFEVLYHFSEDASGCLVTVKALIQNKQTPAIESITPWLPGAEWIEREIHDLLGIVFTGHPNLKRLILADNWPVGVYPLRKETSHENDVE